MVSNPRPAERRRRRRNRAVSPVVGAVAFVGVTICLAAVVAVTVAPLEPGATASVDAAFALEVDPGTSEVAIQHLRGDPVDVRTLSVHVAVEGDALEDQPPVPFFAASGFRGGPGGPFNERADPTWEVGETASLRVASTNAPAIDQGDDVTVTLGVDGHHLATLSARAS